jgi:hypothetical protein
VGKLRFRIAMSLDGSTPARVRADPPFAAAARASGWYDVYIRHRWHRARAGLGRLDTLRHARTIAAAGVTHLEFVRA